MKARVLTFAGIALLIAGVATVARAPAQTASPTATQPPSQAPSPLTPTKTGELRRVVTKLDAAGKAVVMADSQIPLLATRSPNGVGEIWVTQKNPAELSFDHDLAETKTGIQPPRTGTVFRVVDFPPITDAVEKLPLDTMTKVVGPESTPKKGMPPKHSMMHRTRSVDYVIVLSGEIDMVLDDQTVHLKAGDILVQQATNHAWINRSKALARVAFVLMDSQEP